MNRAFIFDFDGVIIDDEQLWIDRENEFLPKLIGEKVFLKLGLTTGLGVDILFKKAKQLGSTVSEREFMQTYFNEAKNIYKLAPLTPGLESLVKILINLNFSIGIVSASPKKWLDVVLDRLSFARKIPVVITLHDQLSLSPKPAPDGYLEAIKELKTAPENTIILEDSNTGIAAAKSSGAYTIALRQNLVEGYKQSKEADAYAGNLQDVIRMVQNFAEKF